MVKQLLSNQAPWPMQSLQLCKLQSEKKPCVSPNCKMQSENGLFSKLKK